MSKTKAKVATKANAKSITNNKITVNVRVKKTAKAGDKVITYKDKHTRVEILQIIAENTGLAKKQVEGVFDELNKLIGGHLKKRGSGEFIVPKTGIKIKRIKKKATKQRNMVSPLTGQEVTINAKPARLSVKLTALKALQELVD
jgi:nucleoid DNA-binding protein